MWFESYPKDREQFVSTEKYNSLSYHPEYGVPQGATLAPILFIIFMNDIIHSSKVFNFSVYADDTCLVLCIDKPKYNETLEEEIKKVADWFSSNELMLNLSKTDYLRFNTHNRKEYIKGEYDLTELHEIAPQCLFDLECAEGFHC